MLKYLEKTPHIKSRIGYANGKKTSLPAGKTRTIAYQSVRTYLWWVGLTALGYYLIGTAVQYSDPTAGWLDIGSMSLPLFAAWSCMVGYAIAGLLPVMLRIISKRGGIKRWKSSKQFIGMVIVYIGYIILLCTLL